MHTTHSNTQHKNEPKHSEMGPVRQNPIQGTVSLFICVCIALCTIVAHNIAQNRPDSFPPYPPDREHTLMSNVPPSYYSCPYQRQKRRTYQRRPFYRPLESSGQRGPRFFPPLVTRKKLGVNATDFYRSGVHNVIE